MDCVSGFVSSNMLNLFVNYMWYLVTCCEVLSDLFNLLSRSFFDSLLSCLFNYLQLLQS